MKKSLLVIFSISGIGIITSSFFTMKPGAFKNLKVLPMNISEHALDSIMDLYSTGLGVDCEFCHTDKGFDSDDNKHKLIAREMMMMTDSINHVFFPEGRGTNQAITCYSCHHGNPSPERFKAEQKKRK